MKPPCNKNCGMCCVGFFFHKGQVYGNVYYKYESWYNGNEDLKHVLQHCRNVTYETAVKANPMIKFAVARINIKELLFYICDWRDSVTGRCKSYTKRPPMCHKFPFSEIKYLNGRIGYSPLSADCAQMKYAYKTHHITSLENRKNCI